DLTEVTPVAIKSPTLLADKDPYSSLKPTLKPEPAASPAAEPIANQKTDNATGPSPVKTANVDAKAPGNQPVQSAPEIRKAIPVQPKEQQPVEIRRAIPVQPVDQEEQGERLLKPATPPPSDTDE